MIKISSKNWAKKNKYQFDRLITIENCDTRYGVRSNKKSTDQLVLTFADLDEPAPGLLGSMAPYRMAEKTDVIRAIEFANGHTDLLVHCHAGISRSTSITLAILIDMGFKTPAMALEQLLRIEPLAVPNMHVVALTDDIFGLGGDLIAYINDWEKDRPQNTRRRYLNRIAILGFNV